MANHSNMPISPPPLRGARPDVPPAYLSNGLIGLRVGCVPPHDGLAMVQGLVGRDPVMRVEAFARAPYPAAGAVAIVRSVEADDELAPLATAYTVDAVPGRTYVLRQLASLVPSQLHEQPDLQALRLAAMGRIIGFDTLREENRRAWADIWTSRVRLLGTDERWQAIVDASFYYLQASAHTSSLFSTAMFGLAY